MRNNDTNDNDNDNDIYNNDSNNTTDTDTDTDTDLPVACCRAAGSARRRAGGTEGGCGRCQSS